MMIDKYCPQNEMEKLQMEFLSLSMVGKDVLNYTQRFNALARLLPNLVTPEIQKVNRYVWGLDARVRGLVKASQPATMKSAIELAAIVTDDRVRAGDFEDDKRGTKRKADEGSDNKRAQDGRPRAYQGTTPMCPKCNKHHQGLCNIRVCYNCEKPGHTIQECRAPMVRKCFECGGTNHYRNACPKLGRNKGNTTGAQGRVFTMNKAAAREEGDVVTGTFRVNHHFATTSIDDDASCSFISTAFRQIESCTLNDAFKVELADGRVIEANEVLNEYTWD